MTESPELADVVNYAGIGLYSRWWMINSDRSSWCLDGHDSRHDVSGSQISDGGNRETRSRGNGKPFIKNTSIAS